MAVVSPGGGGGDDHNDHGNHNGPIDVGIDVEDLLRYHCVKDGNGGGNGDGKVDGKGDGGGGGNVILPSSSIVGRGCLSGRQRRKTS